MLNLLTSSPSERIFLVARGTKGCPGDCPAASVAPKAFPNGRPAGRRDYRAPDPATAEANVRSAADDNEDTTSWSQPVADFFARVGRAGMVSR